MNHLPKPHPPRKAKPLLKKERRQPKAKKEWLAKAATWKAWRAWKENPEKEQPEKETKRANRTKRKPKSPSKTTPKTQVSIRLSGLLDLF